jgi:hypothetical protein
MYHATCISIINKIESNVSELSDSLDIDLSDGDGADGNDMKKGASSKTG